MGTRLPPAFVLAKWLGTGQSNTHAALRALSQRGYLSSSPGRGIYVRKLPAPNVREKSNGRRSPKYIGLVTSNPLDNHATVAALRERLEAAGLGVDQIVHGDMLYDLRRYANLGFDTLVLIYPDLNAQIRFDPSTSLVVLGSTGTIQIQALSRFDFVSVDDAQGARLAGAHARELGCKRPCFIGRADLVNEDRYDLTSEIRCRAFEEGFGCRLSDARRLLTGAYAVTSGERSTLQLLKLDPLPDLVFAVSDEVAMGLLRGTAARGVHAGKDYMLLGFDGTPEGKAAPGGPLSAVERPEEKIVELAVEYILDRLADPDRISRRTQLGCTLFRGATTSRLSEEMESRLQTRGL